ncbi:LAGLIDADG family homing endonuclease, partial [Pyrobaculum aerophilum]|uniref:LAGLIDADG family homing endonuclease n=1 Tax=Pyrobaculum aerophilum TaxID=13773 RepID=UPI0015F25806
RVYALFSTAHFKPASMASISSFDIWWLLGVIVGDGYVGKYFVEISDMHRENLEVAAEVIRRLGFRPVITKDAREKRYRLWVNSSRLYKKSGLAHTPDKLRRKSLCPRALRRRGLC